MATPKRSMADSVFVQKATAMIPQKIRVLPFRAVRIILILILANCIVWIACGIALHFEPSLVATAVLSYTLGLRHALDADHIAAIDLMTRRLIASGQKPVTVGTFFSLGHSTIVIITCIVVAATAGALEERFGGFAEVGGIIGTAVSSTVLLILGIGNAWVLYMLIKRLRVLLAQPVDEDGNRGIDSTVDLGLDLNAGGVMVRIFKKVFQFIDRPWKMYPLGVLFGLGFDTSSEIAVLGIASVQGASGTSLWLILIFPALFTAGMCLLDTTDGALMMTLYTTTALARDTVAILYYSIVLTAITVLVAICIGTIQLLSLVDNVATPEGKFWDGLHVVGDHYDIIGGAICGLFVVGGVAGVLAYRPWRRWVEKGRPEGRRRGQGDEEDVRDDVKKGKSIDGREEDELALGQSESGVQRVLSLESETGAQRIGVSRVGKGIDGDRA